MSTLVNICHQRFLNMAFIDMSCKAYIKGTTKTGSERMGGNGYLTTRKVVTHMLEDALPQGHLLGFCKVTFQTRDVNSISTRLNPLEQGFIGLMCGRKYVF